MSRWLVVVTGVISGAFLLSVTWAIWKTRRMAPAMGAVAMVGATAVARSDLDPEGVVFLNGERWQAVADDGPVHAGERVTVTDVRGLTLRVKRLEGY